MSDASNDQRAAILALRHGDVGGLEVLVRLYQARALRTAYMVVRDQQTAEDIVADGFLVVYDRIEQFDTRRPFEPWFYRIVVNGALKTLRSTQRTRTTHDLESGIPLQRVDIAPGPEMDVIRRETQQQVLDIVQSLPPSQRAALVLRYYLDMDERTIAKTLDCALGTVKWRLHMAKRRMRQSIVQADPDAGIVYIKGETS